MINRCGGIGDEEGKAKKSSVSFFCLRGSELSTYLRSSPCALPGVIRNTDEGFHKKTAIWPFEY
jgi:hypothetical protein